MNILNELVARVQETNSNSLSALVNTESSTSNLWDIWSCFDKLKAIGFGTIENCSSARSARRTIGIMGRKISEDLIGVDPFIQLFKAPLDGSAALPTIQCSSRQTFSAFLVCGCAVCSPQTWQPGKHLVTKQRTVGVVTLCIRRGEPCLTLDFRHFRFW